MVLQQKELVGSVTTQTPNLRFVPYEDGIRPGTMSTVATGPSFAHGTPLTKSGDEWIPWVDAAVIDGLLWAQLEPHVSSATDETHIQVFRRGRVHHDDVPVPAGQTQGALTTALKLQSLRTLGIEVSGVVGVG